MSKLPLNKVLRALDEKDRDFYDSLTDQDKKEIQPYVLMRFLSSVKGSPELQEWFLRATNEYVNRGFWDIPGKHKKLTWLMLTTVSPGMGTHYHEWIAMKTEKKDNKILNLEKVFPDAGPDELKTLGLLYTDKEVKEMYEDIT